MGQSRQRKAAVGILALAVAALVVDKVFIGGTPAGVQAAEAPPKSNASGAPSVPPVASTTDKAAPTGTTLAEALRQYSRRTGMEIRSTPDAFSPAPMITASADEAAAVENHSDEEFIANHTLHFVLFSDQPEKCMVRVNGKRLHIGESIDGYRLGIVTRRAAGFEAGGHRVRLDLQEPKLNPEE
jgi:hypothetical protein